MSNDEVMKEISELKNSNLSANETKLMSIVEKLTARLAQLETQLQANNAFALEQAKLAIELFSKK